jgi:Na+/proline symporter
MANRAAIRSWVVATGAFVLAVATYLLLTAGHDDALPPPTMELAVWQVLLSVQVAVWAVLAVSGLHVVQRVPNPWDSKDAAERAREWRRATQGFLTAVYAAIVLQFVLAEAAGIEGPPLFAAQHSKIRLLHGLAALASAPFLVALKRIQLTAADPVGWSTASDDIRRIRALRRTLRTATASLGTIIALAVVSTGAGRRAMVVAEKTEPLPESVDLLYGAWFTAILGAVYLYVFAALESRARSLLDDVAPLPHPRMSDLDGFTTSTRMRRELSDELELGGDVRKNFEGLVAVFAPLLGALLSQIGGL